MQMRRVYWILVPVLALVSCGGADSGPQFDAQSDLDAEEESECETCTSHDECDDGIACTRDTCVIGGCCEHQPDDGECPEGEVCDPDVGCVSSECSSDEDCDDGKDCTLDTCLVDHTCSHTDTCPSGSICTEEGCTEIIPCTEDEECQIADGVFCNGDEWCDPEFGCQPAERPRECLDDDDCTVDVCDTELDMCTFTCDPTLPECEDACPCENPYPGCFRLASPLAYWCALHYVDYNFDVICFEVIGLSLTASIHLYESGSGTLLPGNTGTPMAFDESPAPEGCSCNLRYTVSGACDEDYFISGTFTDTDHFSGTWRVTFTPTTAGGCAFSGCVNQHVPISGTRI